MKLRSIALFALFTIVLLALSACEAETALRFSNRSACGAAVITLQDAETGNVREYTVEQGDTVKITVTHSRPYTYEVTYPNPPEDMECEAKTVNTVPQRGQTLNISLLSATATPRP